ncbi:MAG: hypothetical protein AVDCRST_MAG91-2094 [uncultured Sphingomonadaceae bacterium]|uniref:Uncharacterized protein n=1 Tax=uncultured Sphingomonadaceae bacterium TaxID=169976 RepID=A0A6J4TB74_9SPHN|nr:MAG: hypothetical protein AVDCRST_MAG91-2094 [uncultured Sphingomonadaceae bacterium]
MSNHPDPAAAATPPATMDEDGFSPPQAYDPAEYRWVPVRRTPRYDGWTEEKLRRFIEVLADTGQASLAAKAVGMSRESAYKLRRSAHGAAFARAWDAARAHAGSFLEDVAFERAIEGVEHNVYNEYGEVICTKRVHNDRLLMFLLRHLKPERYARDALAQAPASPEPVDAALRALEPPLPADPARLLGPEALDDALVLADAADGELPHFLSEQRPAPTPRQTEARARAAQEARGEAAWDKVQKGGQIGDDEFADMCRFIDPTSRAEPSRKRYR